MAIDIKAVISAVDQTGPAFKSAQRNVTDFASQARRAAGLLAGVFGAASLTGLAKSAIDSADALSKLSTKVGVSVKDLASLKLAAEQSDTSLEGVGNGIARLSRSIGEAEGGNRKLGEALRELGISSRDPKEAFFQLADAVKRIEDPNKRAVLLSQVLGKSYQDLLPLLAQGGEALRRSAQASESFADTMARMAPNAERFNDDLTAMKNAAAGAAAAVTERLVPGLAETSARVRELLDDDRGVLALLRAFAGLGKIPFDLIFGNIRPINSAAEHIDELNKKLAQLKRNLASAGPNSRGGLLGSSEDIRREIAVVEKQIDVVKKLGSTLYKPKAAPAPRDLGQLADAPAAGRKSGGRAADEARREAVALLRAQEVLEKARRDAVAQGLDDSITARRENLEQARKAELIDEAGFIAAKAALDEEALRNELAALQGQRDRLRAASTDPRANGSARTQALAELALVEARIQSAGDKILNLNVAATADIAALGVAKLKAQADFLDGLEQEAFLSGLANDEREAALLLLEAEKLGIEDVNRLLELQTQIRANANAKKAAEELQRQQDDLYKSVQEGVQRAFADGLNAVGTGSGGIRAALLGIVNTIRSALSNAIAGSLTESFLGLLGGKDGVLNIAGSLGLGGKKDGSSPASAIFVRDVAAGGLPGAAGDGGGMFAGFFEGIQSFFSNLAGSLSSLFSNLAGSLSGLFSGGGGGGFFSALAGAFGFADGGFTGPGGKYQPAGVVHAGEYVFSAESVRRLGLGALDNLHRISRGSMIPRTPRIGYAEGGLVNLPGSGAPTVNANTKVVNMFDLDSALAEYLNTRAGERAVLNIIQRNPGAAGA